MLIEAGRVTHHPDAELLELGRQLAVIVPLDKAASDRFDEMNESYREPPVPDGLIRNAKLDSMAGIHLFGSKLPDGRRWYGAPSDIATLRKPCLRQDSIQTVEVEGGFICPMVPDPVAQARADEILAAYETWRAEIAASRLAHGIVQAEEEMDRISERYRALRSEIGNMPARTVDGLIVKARCAYECFGGEDMEEAVEPHADDLARGLVRDVIRVSTVLQAAK